MGLNHKRLDKLIAALRSRAGKKMFYIGSWKHVPEGARQPAGALKAGAKCGTTACIAGFAAAISPRKWAWTEYSDVPRYTNAAGTQLDGSMGFAAWLGIPEDDSYSLCLPDSGDSVWAPVFNRVGAHGITSAMAARVLVAYGKHGMEGAQREVARIEKTL